MGPQLTTKEVAGLCGKHESTIRRWVESGKIQAEKFLNEFNSPEYLFSVDCLPPDIQQKYFYRLKANLPVPPEGILPGHKASKPLDHYTANEREAIAFWLRLVADWQEYRKKPGANKTEVDEKFVLLCKLEHPELQISVDTLYRRWKAIKQNDLDGLIDKRGKWKQGKNTIPPEAWDAFLYFYLQEAQYPMMKCYEYMLLLLREDHPDLVADIPSYTTFTRHVKSDIQEAVEVLGRQGEKAFRDRCAPYIRRVNVDMKL